LRYDGTEIAWYCVVEGIVKVLLAWRGIEIDGESESILLNAVDLDGNAAVHYGAMHGLQDCVSKLIECGVHLSIVNKVCSALHLGRKRAQR
jgi:hypothetical protein